MLLKLDLYQTVAMAVLVYSLGAFIKKKAPVLNRYCIPAPVVGGILFGGSVFVAVMLHLVKTVTQQIEKKEQRLAVKQAVLSMPYPEREIFLRHYYYYQKTEDISREMNIPLSTVKTKLRRGRIRLGDQLKTYLL